MSEKLYEYKTIRSKGAYHHLVRMHGEENWKHHKWDGPAIEPIEGKNSEWKKRYFLNGTEYNSEEYSELMKEREGLPWYKTSKGRAGENRN
tara:strand:- start:970 stop:1242 length:273 start_codon:yes stop_codon:yes gene_type:complete